MEATILKPVQTDMDPHTLWSSTAAGWVEGAVTMDRLMSIAAGGCSAVVEFGKAV